MKKEKYIYVAFVRSNTKAGGIIRKITGWKYSHVSIALDKTSGKFYAFSRLNYQSSFMAGFTTEYKSNYTLLNHTPAEVTYYKIPITEEELNTVKAFIYMLSRDKEYIFNYPSMFTTTILHGFRIYKSYNCITFVSKILSFLRSVKLSKKYYKYDLNELERDVISFYDSKESFQIERLDFPNPFFDKIHFCKRKEAELKLLSECFYRLVFQKCSNRYRLQKKDQKIKKQTVAIFNLLASGYDNSLSGYNPRKNYGKIINKLELNENYVLLDVGCGTGEILNRIAGKYQNVQLYGIDISPKMLQIAKKKDVMRNKIEYVWGDAENLPFDNDTFDILLTSESFHHYPNPRQAMREFSRVLKPEGKIILCDMYRPAGIRHFMNFMFRFTRTGDVRIYSKKEIFDLLAQSQFSMLSWEQHYSGFICEAVNDKTV